MIAVLKTICRVGKLPCGQPYIIAISKRRWIVLLAAVLILVSAPIVSNAQSNKPWFETEAINLGLAGVPKNLDRSTPRGTVEGFLAAVRADDLELAAHFLDLSGIAKEKQPTAGPELAGKLGTVVERRIKIDWGDFPDRPDAVQEQGSDRNPLVGVPRRSLRMGVLDLADRRVTLRINRLKTQASDPIWLISRQSIRNIPALYDVFGPGWFEKRLPPSWLKRSGFGLANWELVALPVLLIVAVGLFLAIRGLSNGLSRRVSGAVAQTAVEASRTPLALFVTAFLLDYATTKLLTFSASITTVISPLLLTAMVIAIAIAILRVIDTVLDVITKRYVGEIDDEQSAEERSTYTSIYALRRVVVLLAFAIGAGVVLMQLHLFDTLGASLLASAGVVTVILGIAGQTVLGNIMASLQIAFAKPIRIGDSVHYEGDWAYVEAIFYTFVRLRTWDDRRLIVPVKYFVSNPFENWSMQDAKMTRTFRIVADHNADVSELRDAFFAMASKDEDVMQNESTKVLVVDHDANGVHVRFYATAADPTTAWEMHARLREGVITWIRKNHPEWWPRERVADVSHKSQAMRAGSVGDPV